MRQRKIPKRTCLGCREPREKKALIRVVRTPEGSVELDPIGKKPGRGAYICPDTHCLEQAVKRRQLERALQCSIPVTLKDELEKHLHERR